MRTEYWKLAVLQGLKDLSDEEFQERVWLRHEGTKSSTPIEGVNQLFDDTGLSDVLDTGVVFSHQADELLKRLSRNIDKVNLNQPVHELLSLKEWKEITHLASQAYNEVKKVLDFNGDGSDK